jgi:hypothetical protein
VTSRWGAGRLGGRATASSLLACVLLGACRESVSIDPDAPRRPDGVSLDKAPSWPAPESDASAADGVATLRTPLGTDEALDVLHRYVRAIVTEDAAAMRALHTSDATFVSSPIGQPSRAWPGIVNIWERRFARFDYGALEGSVVVREADAQVRRLRSPDEGGPQVSPPADDEPATMPARGAEVLVRAPIATSRVGGLPLLGSELVLYMRRQGDGYRVSAVVEDYALP